MKVNISKYPKGDGDRKINVQIERFDTFSLDHTLAHIIYPALLQLKAEKQGVPSDFINDVGGEEYVDQTSFDFYTDTHDEAFRERVKEWDIVLDKMIWSFEQILKDEYDNLYHHGDPKYDWIKTDKQYPNPISGKLEDTYQMVDKNPEEHWYDFEGNQLHEERIQEGLMLFGKYYRTLWS